MTDDHTNDAEAKRAGIREELGKDEELEDELATDEASFAPPGHLGERMNEAERRERF
jgi:hypothetical protein